MADEVRLINYDAAIDRYYAEYEKQDICDGAQDRDWLKKCFDEAPTIDPESLRPKGRWESVDGTKSCDEWDCTACKQRQTFMDEMELDDMIECSPYCPNCGADMREG